MSPLISKRLCRTFFFEIVGRDPEQLDMVSITKHKSLYKFFKYNISDPNIKSKFKFFISLIFFIFPLKYII